jgi:hypothetical protein
MAGSFLIGTSVWPSLPPPYSEYVPWRLISFAIEDEWKSLFASDEFRDNNWRFEYVAQPNQALMVAMPYWFLVALFATITAVT